MFEECRRQEKGGQISSEKSVAEEGTWQWRLLRSYARVRSAVALARKPATANSTRSALNPLSLVGVGRLMSHRDCDSVLTEAQRLGVWEPWDGDLGEGCTAQCVKDLPRSRALWEGSVGKSVRARIARLYGVRQSAVVSDASNVFVCRTSLTNRARVENEGINLAIRTTQPYHNKNGHTGSRDFRRSGSLITFSVQLSPRDTETSSWAVCFEQPGRCVMPVDQGAGLIFSGKMRHASFATHFHPAPARELPREEGGNDARDNAAVMLLRGFADIRGTSGRGHAIRWDWGRPAWHVDAPWIKDEEILDRVWVASGDEGSRLERMNTSLAHRYFRQGLGGMDVSMVDGLGRPVVDLQEQGSKRWIPRSGGSGAEVTITAALRRRHAWDPRRRVIGRVGLSTKAGTSQRMDAALQELFTGSADGESGRQFERVSVPPIKYVFVDPRYRGFGLGRRLFLEAMSCLARRGFRFALIIVEDNGRGSLFDFYEQMGFVRAEEQLGLPRAMIAPIPPPKRLLSENK